MPAVGLRQAAGGTGVQCTGIDVSLEVSDFCVVDAAGKVVKEARVANRAGMTKAEVALARMLAVFMHRMRSDGTYFDPKLAAA